MPIYPACFAFLFPRICAFVCYDCQPITDRWTVFFPPEGMRIAIQRRPASPFTCSYTVSSLDQYRITYSSAGVPVIPCYPIRCDVEVLMAPGGKPSCLTTLPAVRHCQSQCEPTDSQTHLQSDGGLRSS